MELNEMIIIGAGPAGISMAAEAINSGIPADKVVIIEKSHEHSWAIRKFYPETKLVTANYKGKDAHCDGVLCLMDSSKQETLSYLDKIIDDKKINVSYNESVHKMERMDDGSFLVETNTSKYHAKICSIAIGMFGKPNKPSYALPSSAKSRILFDITSREIKDEKILIVGGGDSASEYAQYLVQQNKDITLSYRQETFARMNDINRETLLDLEKGKKVEILYKSNIESLEDIDEKIKVNFTELPAITYDTVVYALGGSTPTNFLSLLGIAFEGNQPIIKDGFETSVPGLFLLGDLSAGKKGGSIISAFNSSHSAMKKICTDYLACKI